MPDAVDVSGWLHLNTTEEDEFRAAITRANVEMHPQEIANIKTWFFSDVPLTTSRHAMMINLLCQLRGYGLLREDAETMAEEWMSDRGREPGPGELSRASDYVEGKIRDGTLNIRGQPCSIIFSDETATVEPAPPTPEQAVENAQANTEAVIEWPTQPNAMARRAYADLFGSERYVRWAENDYEWTGVYWKQLTFEENLAARLQRASGMTPTACERGARALRNDHLKEHLTPPCTLVDGQPIPPRIPLANGWISAEEARNNTFVLEPYSVAVFDTVPPMPVAFDPSANCPRFRQFLNEIFEGADEAKTALIRLMGYLLTKGNEYQKVFICTGLPSSGKSTWLRVMRELLGHHRSSVGDMRSFSSEFGLASCYQAQALFLPESSHSEGGTFVSGEAIDQLKRISGSDPVLVRIKYESDVQVASMPTPVVICNMPPIVRDEAFIRRLVTIHFPHSFLGREDHTLLSQLLAELPGILNLAFRGLTELRQHRDPFPPPAIPATPEEDPSPARALYEAVRADSSPLAEFVIQCLQPQQGNFLSYRDLHTAYTRWHGEAMSGRALNYAAFVRVLLFAVNLPRSRRQINGERHRGVENYGWSPAGLRAFQGSAGF